MAACSDCPRSWTHSLASSRQSGAKNNHATPRVCGHLQRQAQARHALDVFCARRRQVGACVVSRAASRALEQIDYKTLYMELPSMAIIDEGFLWTKRLLPMLEYLSDEQRERVRMALAVAYAAHSGQCRKSGEPFITHPVEVTRILAELKMDTDSLIAGLLHDTVEDTDYVSFEGIQAQFGESVRRIVEGETKLSKITKYSSGKGADSKARDLQQLFLAMTEEVRIILVKLADRLHNMRTLDSMAPEKRVKIAVETLTVFVPLAKLLGLYCLKDELEDLSFFHQDSEAYCRTARKFEELMTRQQAAITASLEHLREALARDPLLREHAQCCDVQVRQKALYSTYSKLRAAGKTLKDLQSVSQLQITIAEQPQSGRLAYSVSHQLCYHVLGLVHALWSPVPGTLKDYIATPKTNGYQSLHTTVLPLTILDRHDCNLIALSIQIRSSNMERLAEYGVAARNWVPHPLRLNGMQLSTSHPLQQPPRYLSPYHPHSSPPSPSPLYTNGNGRKPLGGPLPLDHQPGQARHPNGNSNSHRSGALNGYAGLASNGSGIGSANSNGSLGPSSTTRTSSGYSALHINSSSLNGTGKLLGAALGLGVAGDGAAAVQRASEAGATVSPNWMVEIRKWQEDFLGSVSASEFVDGVTNDLLNQGVYVYTPQGELRRMPKGATVVDFAYHLHTDIGNSMRAARVNGTYVKPSYELNNGEVVEVVRDPGLPDGAAVRRHAKWVQAVKTRTAKFKIRQFLKENAHLMHARGGRGAASQLRVECSDRQGILAFITSTISDAGINIKSYSGKPEGTTFVMRFYLGAVQQERLQLLQERIAAHSDVQRCLLE